MSTRFIPVIHLFLGFLVVILGIQSVISTKDDKIKVLARSLRKNVDNLESKSKFLDRNKRGFEEGDKHVYYAKISGPNDLVRSVIKEAGLDIDDEPFNDNFVLVRRKGDTNKKIQDIGHKIENPNDVESVKIEWVEKEEILQREKRSLLYSDFPISLQRRMFDQPNYMRRFNDPHWPKQQYNFELIPLWEMGITGKGVNVIIMDDGVECDHKELRRNCDPSLCYNAFTHENDSTPRYERTNYNRHGTLCAGIVAMQENNDKCGVGVAYEANVGGIQSLDGKITYKVESHALSAKAEKADVITASWGPRDNGETIEEPGGLTQTAFSNGIKYGRNGRGIIYVWAAGNGGMNDDNCNCDGYASHIYTINVNSIGTRNEPPAYAEKCASILSSTWSNSLVSSDLRGTCELHFSGTSTAAPLMAGYVALVLQVNPKMTWRDMQYAVIFSSSSRTLTGSKWVKNGAGLKYSIHFGFGLISPTKMVKYAQEYPLVSDKAIVRINKSVNMNISSGRRVWVIIEKKVSSEIASLEHVVLEVTLNHSRRGDLEIYLTSPHGTKVPVLTTRRKDDSNEGYSKFPFMSVATWGEKPNGKWRVDIYDKSRRGESGIVYDVNLVLHGAKKLPKPVAELLAKTPGFSEDRWM